MHAWSGRGVGSVGGWFITDRHSPSRSYCFRLLCCLPGQFYYTPFLLACWRGDLSIARWLVHDKGVAVSKHWNSVWSTLLRSTKTPRYLGAL